jgi:outer membrane receptor protein involved in Fe transport
MKTRYMLSCAVAAILGGAASTAGAAPAELVATAAGLGAPGAADQTGAPAVTDQTSTTKGFDEVVVTAQRRSESVQKVPMTIQAFRGDTLDSLNITTFDDLLKFTPNVTYGNNGPGQGSIFMRGLSAGFAGNQSSATVGNFPNVAIYLDDQSMQFPARNIDIYMVDMERVEVLEGPQGTLFGGGAEAGALRYITNKPKLDVFEGKAEASYGGTTHGDPNSSFNVVVNVPIVQDKLAVRAVLYNDQHGGYIDNVPSNFNRSNSDAGNYYFGIKPVNGLCPNGLPSSAYCALPASAAPGINNSAIARNAQNPLTYQGARFSADYKLNEDWDVLITESLQSMDAEGLYVEFPTGSNFQPLAPLQVTAFNPSYDKDSYGNTAWTVTGKVGDFKAVYTGGWTERHISQQMDYTNYSRTAGGMYYQCTGGSTGWGGAAQCYSPSGYWQDTVKNTHLTEEFRISTPDAWRLRGILGAYYEQFRIYDVMNFNYKTIPACNTVNLDAALAGGQPCIADVITAPGSTASAPGVRSDNTAFGEDTQRGYDQTAFFGSVDFDIIPKVLTVTVGTRYYQYNEFETGSEYYTDTSLKDIPNGSLFQGININNNNDKVTYSGFKSRANITWRPNAHTTVYYLFSQGFRPGAFSRGTGFVADYALKSEPQYQKPNGYAPDSLTNNEIGFKTDLFERRLQLNVSAYYMQWDNAQFLLFNPSELGNTTFAVNGPSYDIKGVETQFVARVAEGLTVQGSTSYNDNTQSNSPCLVDNVAASINYGKCITQIFVSGTGLVPFQNPFGSAGSVSAFSPQWQANLRGRYDWRFGDYKAYALVSGNYTGSMYNEPSTYLSGAGVTIPTTTYLRYLQPAYATFDASIGVAKDRWAASFFCNNIGDSHASTFTSSAQFIKSEVPLRPRTFGVKLSSSF